MKMADVLARLRQVRVIPVATLESIDEARSVANALIAANLPIIEVTFRTENVFEVIKFLTDHYSSEELLIGAGTVITRQQIDQVVGCRANFIVCPGFSQEIVQHCSDTRMPVIPGVESASEVQIAVAKNGLTVLKQFPANLERMKTLNGPFPQVQWIPTGGINKENMTEYLRYAKVLAVGGSWMVSRSLIEMGRFSEITRLAQEALSLVPKLSS